MQLSDGPEGCQAGLTGPADASYTSLVTQHSLANRLATLYQAKLFDGFTDREIGQITQLGHTNTFADGAHIFWQGDPGVAMYAILQGGVRIARDVDGELHTIDTSDAGDVFGESALISAEPRSASAIAIGETELFVINEDVLELLMTKYPRMAAKIFVNLIRIVGSRLRTHINRRTVRD